MLLNNDKYQINTPRNLSLNKFIGKIIDIGTTGSACIALNGKNNLSNNFNIFDIIEIKTEYIE